MLRGFVDRFHVWSSERTCEMVTSFKFSILSWVGTRSVGGTFLSVGRSLLYHPFLLPSTDTYTHTYLYGTAIYSRWCVVLGCQIVVSVFKDPLLPSGVGQGFTVPSPPKHQHAHTYIHEGRLLKVSLSKSHLFPVVGEVVTACVYTWGQVVGGGQSPQYGVVFEISQI
jgi:hypothetical protein